MILLDCSQLLSGLEGFMMIRGMAAVASKEAGVGAEVICEECGSVASGLKVST